jgi:hypothetical protein
MDDVKTCVYANNPGSIGNTMISPNVTCNGDVFYFDTNGNSDWNIVGGYFDVGFANSGIPAAFHYSSTFNGGLTGQDLVSTGTHYEAYGTNLAQFVRHDDAGPQSSFTCYGCNDDSFGRYANRALVTLVSNNTFKWYSGTFAGEVKLNTTISGAAPYFLLADAVWDPTGDGSYPASGMPPSTHIDTVFGLDGIGMLSNQ